MLTYECMTELTAFVSSPLLGDICTRVEHHPIWPVLYPLQYLETYPVHSKKKRKQILPMHYVLDVVCMRYVLHVLFYLCFLRWLKAGLWLKA